MNKNKLIQIVVGVFISLTFFLIIEVSLRLTGNSEEITVFKEYKADTSYLVFNPEISKRIFYNKDEALLPQIDPFKKNKKSNTLRIFVLGASTAYGFPFTHNTSFPRILERSLSDSYEGIVEIINLSLTGINSYTLQELSESLIHQEADAVLIYAGHNEFYGVHGVASSYSLTRNSYVKQFILNLKKLKTYDLLRKLLITKNKIKKNQKNLMQKLSSEQLIDKKEALFEDGVDQFKTNLSALVKTLSDHQIPIYIGTLSSNLLQPPLDHSATQRTTFLSLELYNQGMKKLEKNDIQKGIQLLHRAKEEDQLRFRAPKAFNDIILNLKNPYVTIVDLESVFQSDSVFINKENYFLEHVHPNIKGYYLMAFEFHNSIAKHMRFSNNSKIAKSSSYTNYYDTYSTHTTVLDSIYGHLLTDRLLTQWPFYQTSESEYHDQSIEYDLANKMLSHQLNWVQAMDLYYRKSIENQQYDKARQVALSLMQEIPISDQPIKYYLNALQSLDSFDEILDFAISYVALEDPDFQLISTYVIAAFQNNPDIKSLEDFIMVNEMVLGEFGNYLSNLLITRKEAEISVK